MVDGMAITCVCLLLTTLVLMVFGFCFFGIVFISRYIRARLYEHYTGCTRKEAFKKYKIY